MTAEVKHGISAQARIDKQLRILKARLEEINSSENAFINHMDKICRAFSPENRKKLPIVLLFWISYFLEPYNKLVAHHKERRPLIVPDLKNIEDAKVAVKNALQWMEQIPIAEFTRGILEYSLFSDTSQLIFQKAEYKEAAKILRQALAPGDCSSHMIPICQRMPSLKLFGDSLKQHIDELFVANKEEGEVLKKKITDIMDSILQVNTACDLQRPIDKDLSELPPESMVKSRKIALIHAFNIDIAQHYKNCWVLHSCFVRAKGREKANYRKELRKLYSGIKILMTSFNALKKCETDEGIEEVLKKLEQNNLPAARLLKSRFEYLQDQSVKLRPREMVLAIASARSRVANLSQVATTCATINLALHDAPVPPVKREHLLLTDSLLEQKVDLPLSADINIQNITASLPNINSISETMASFLAPTSESAEVATEPKVDEKAEVSQVTSVSPNPSQAVSVAKKEDGKDEAIAEQLVEAFEANRGIEDMEEWFLVADEEADSDEWQTVEKDDIPPTPTLTTGSVAAMVKVGFHTDLLTTASNTSSTVSVPPFQ